MNRTVQWDVFAYIYSPNNIPIKAVINVVTSDGKPFTKYNLFTSRKFYVLRRFYILNGIASLIIISPFAMTVCKNGSRVNFVAGSTSV